MLSKLNTSDLCLLSDLIFSFDKQFLVHLHAESPGTKDNNILLGMDNDQEDEEENNIYILEHKKNVENLNQKV